jgi:hypothetical protein
MSGTRVTCTDIESGESETATITDNFVVITDGSCFVDSQQIHANGTTVLTIKGRK